MSKVPLSVLANQERVAQRQRRLSSITSLVASLLVVSLLMLVKKTKLIYGTNWENPLEMAIAMEPPPQMIFFMTDGVVGGDMVALAKRIGHRAKTKGITINTVAMMEPKAAAAMKELAKRTGGQFSMVEKNGKVKVIPVK